MLKKFYFVLFFIMIIFVAIISASIGYNMYDKESNKNQIVESKNEANMDFLKEQEKPVDNITVAKITPSTKMTYEYYYKDDSIT